MLSLRNCTGRSVAALGMSVAEPAEKRNRLGRILQRAISYAPHGSNVIFNTNFQPTRDWGPVLSTLGSVPLFFPIVGQMCVCVYRRHQLQRARACVILAFHIFSEISVEQSMEKRRNIGQNGEAHPGAN
jgi:hypothetical protein